MMLDDKCSPSVREGHAIDHNGGRAAHRGYSLATDSSQTHLVLRELRQMEQVESRSSRGPLPAPSSVFVITLYSIFNSKKWL